MPVSPVRVDTALDAIGRLAAGSARSDGDQRPAADAAAIVEMPTAGNRESLGVTITHVIHVRLAFR
jgi:hypothetical protein